jgi:hypothetical protein
MLAFLTLCTLLFAGVVCVAAIAAVGIILKVVFHAIFWPLKILLLPLILIGLLIKLALIAAVFGVILIVLIPLGLVVLLFAAPFFIAGALT